MSELTIYDTSGQAWPAQLVDGTPEVESDGWPNFSFQVKRLNSMGSIYWFVNGELHRLDGPAIEYANGTKAWWVNGNMVNKSDYPEMVQEFLDSGIMV